jgi:hypothetical protein
MSERGSRPERVGVINLLWIAVNMILVCAVVMVERSLGSYWSCPASGNGYFVGNLGLVGFIVDGVFTSLHLMPSSWLGSPEILSAREWR